MSLFSIYQNGIRTATEGRDAGKTGATWQTEKKVFIKDSEVEVGGERSGREKNVIEMLSPQLIRQTVLWRSVCYSR